MAGQAVDARVLRDAMSRYLEALRRHREEIDSLNVFPIPDADTGTNLLLTQEAVSRALSETEHGDLAVVGDLISRASLMGARGNSGVIMSQVLRGLCGRLGRDPSAGGDDLAEALSRASDEARRAVAHPVDGTMLSVLDDAAEGARRATADGAGPAEVADAALLAGTDSLDRTRQLLPALAEAGVVDAGGKGLVLLLDAFRSAIRESPSSVEVGPLGPVGGPAASGSGSAERHGFEVMYLLECDDSGVPALRDRLGSVGDSLVVVGGGGLYNVHVHTDRPGRAVEEGIGVGRPRDIRITSLDEQVAGTCVAGEARAVRVEEPATSAQSLVAVVEGAGLARLFESVGATVILGGPGNNPSVGELVDAVDRAPGRIVHVLPNDEDVVPAARAAEVRSTKRVEVVPAGSIPQGLAAALAFDPERSTEANLRSMGAAADGCASGAVAFAAPDGSTEAGAARRGDCLGLRGDEVKVIGSDPGEVAAELVTRHLGAEGHELVSLYLGAEISDEEGRGLAEAVRAAAPDLEVEVHRGGQVRFQVLIGLE
jgi:DAK2 domain fusion protein YloV